MTQTTPSKNSPAESDIFASGQTFAELGLRPEILDGITKMGFVHPTHVQTKLIPLENRNGKDGGVRPADSAQDRWQVAFRLTDPRSDARTGDPGHP